MNLNQLLLRNSKYDNSYSQVRVCTLHLQQRYSTIDLTCVTEQTHDIHVYGLCDGARFAVPHNFA